MASTTDEELAASIANDPFHQGLAEHGENTGFKYEPMSDEEIKKSRERLGRLGLVLGYFGILALMAKAYA